MHCSYWSNFVVCVYRLWSPRCDPTFLSSLLSFPLQIFDTCERFEGKIPFPKCYQKCPLLEQNSISHPIEPSADHLHAIVRNAGQAHSKARTILIEKEKKKRSKSADKPSSTRPSSSDSETTQQAQEPAMADFVHSFSTIKTKSSSAHLAEVHQKRDTYT